MRAGSLPPRGTPRPRRSPQQRQVVTLQRAHGRVDGGRPASLLHYGDRRRARAGARRACRPARQDVRHEEVRVLQLRDRRHRRAGERREHGGGARQPLPRLAARLRRDHVRVARVRGHVGHGRPRPTGRPRHPRARARARRPRVGRRAPLPPEPRGQGRQVTRSRGRGARARDGRALRRRAHLPLRSHRGGA